jgi:ParB-like chromosome segregation protein Spo0J
VIRLSLGDLVRHPKNRKVSGEAIDERAASMAESGQLEPIIVRKIGEMLDDLGGPPLRYQILSGETRWLAAKKLGWTKSTAA